MYIWIYIVRFNDIPEYMHTVCTMSFHPHLCAYVYRFNFLDTEELSSDDDEDVFQTGSKPKHVSFPPMGSPRVKSSGQKERSSSPVVPRRMDSSPTSSSPMLPRQVINSGNTKQTASPLVGRSISEGPMSGSSSPFTGSPIIFRKDFVKGSPFGSPHLKRK